MPEPAWLKARSEKFDELKKKYEESISPLKGKPIELTLPDGSKKEAKAYETTPLEIAMSISEGLAQHSICAKVNGKTWDMNRPLEESCTFELLKFDDPAAKKVFWHSSAHLLGEALEMLFGVHLCIGPPLEDGGFYYDCYLPPVEGEAAEKATLGQKDYEAIEEKLKQIVNEKQQFERIMVSKEDALALFSYNKFKTELIQEKVPEGGSCSIYRSGMLIDVCKGPHLLHSGKVKSNIKITKNSSSYWKGDSDKESLQRMYGISFPDAKMLKEWIQFQEEAKKRDHREIAKQQELFFFHDFAPGMAFFLPKGQILFNKLVAHIKKEIKKRGYSEVQTPNIFSCELWKTSGHWDKYQENMFLLDIDGQKHSTKPMNCPAHCLMFRHRTRSYKELPIRFADFGVLHRNELKGALSGLTRVRRFQQDDAHIFCADNQIQSEILGVLQLIEETYTIFGFKLYYFLSTRPEKYLGTVEIWDRAEGELKQALEKFGKKYEISPGDGAFYGPKIDILIEDALKRKHQLATCQLDFNLPIRFDLTYVNDQESGERQSRVAMIHRAIYGSMERFIAVLAEHCAGKWPFWISPRQAIVLPISNKNLEYAQKVQKQLQNAGFEVDIDESENTINKKVRNGQLAQYNFMLIVGEKEMEKNSVNIRVRDSNEVIGEKSVEECIEFFKQLEAEHK